MKTNRIQKILLSIMMLAVCCTVDAQLGKSLLRQAKNSAETKVRIETSRAVNKGLDKGTAAVKEAATSKHKSPTSNSVENAKTIYVNHSTGSNRNDGSKASPLKNIQKAIDVASDGTIIYVAEGNYFGTLNSGNIFITKPVEIYGGYSSDFSTRDILKYRTLVQPDPKSNGTQKGQGTVRLQVRKPGSRVVIDGIIFDRGNAISYNTRGEGKPEGLQSAMMQPIGAKGLGGPNLEMRDVLTAETAEIYLENPQCDFEIRNCAFLNAPNYGIRGSFRGKAKIINNIFINNRMAACEIPGADAKINSEIEFAYNTVLFMWSRLRDLATMGYGYRYMTGVNSYVHHNILGCSIYSALDRARVDSSKAREKERITTSEHNIFFLNKQADLIIPGGGVYLMINVPDFEDVEQLAKVEGNKELKDPSVLKGKINEAYLNGFLSATYKEKTSSDPNSPANTFRSAMGMNMVGTMSSSVSMYANRYPWEEALLLFGAMNGYGAQIPSN